jgi:hypothetical protein
VASILAGQDRAHLQEINRVYEEKSSLSFRAHAFPRHESLAEGITQGDMEIQLRNTVSLLSSAEIESVKRSDPKLIASLTTDSNLSAATKEALSIYLGGKDKINTADRLHLADIGIRNNDMRFIEEAFRGSTPADREAFRTTGMASQLEGRFAGTKGKHILERVISGLGVLPGATPLMMLSFDPSLYKDEKREQDSAKSYAAFGKVDAGTQIKHNHSFIYSPNIAGMDRGIASMSDEKKASTKPVMT